MNGLSDFARNAFTVLGNRFFRKGEGGPSSLRRVPVETLVAIFNECVEDAIHCNTIESWEPYSTLDPRSAPMVLTHVCRCWRDIVLNTPRLWAHVVLLTPMKFAMLPPLPRIFSRCKAHPMALTIQSHSDPDYRNTDNAPRLESLRLLSRLFDTLDFPRNLQKMQLCADEYDYYELNEEDLLPIFSFPSLHTLHLRFRLDDPFPISILREILHLFKNSPVLREFRLTIDHHVFDIFDVAPRFPWSQLTRLRISGEIHFAGIHALLSRCVNLTECRFDAPDDDLRYGCRVIYDDPWHPTVILPHLETLMLFIDEDVIFQFFLWLDFPRLNHLAFHAWHNYDGGALSSLRAAAPKLASVEIHIWSQKSAEEAAYFLAEFPSLEHLHLHDLEQTRQASAVGLDSWPLMGI